MFEAAREFVRWGMKSGLGLGINLVLLTVWVEKAGIRPEYAIFINWVLLSVYGYLITHHWVFKDTKELTAPLDHVRQYVGMQGILAGSKVLNYAIYVLLIHVGLDYRASWVVGAGVAVLASFGLNREWWKTGPSNANIE